MIGDYAKGLIASHTTDKPLQAHIRVNVRGYGVPVDQVFEDKERGIYTTTGGYWVALRPSLKLDRKKEGNFVVYCDMFQFRSRRFKDWEDFAGREEEDEIIRFLLQYTQISATLFEMAAKNKSLMIPFCLDVVRYSEHLKQATGGVNELLGAEIEMEAAYESRLEYKQALINKKIAAEKVKNAAARENKKK